MDVDYILHLNIGASIQWVTKNIGFVRGGDNWWSWGKPYEFTCMVLRTGDTVECIGYLGLYNRSIRKALLLLLLKRNILHIKYERMNTDTRRLKSIKL